MFPTDRDDPALDNTDLTHTIEMVEDLRQEIILLKNELKVIKEYLNIETTHIPAHLKVVNKTTNISKPIDAGGLFP